MRHGNVKRSRVFSALLIGAFAALMVAGCSTLSERAQNLSLGMSKGQAISTLGSSYTTEAARMEGERQVEVLKFTDEQSSIFVYLRDDKVVQWGDKKVLDNIPRDE